MPVEDRAPRRNAVAVVGAIIEMTVDWLNDPEPDLSTTSSTTTLLPRRRRDRRRAGDRTTRPPGPTTPATTPTDDAS
jgi:hypothetical protein